MSSTQLGDVTTHPLSRRVGVLTSNSMIVATQPIQRPTNARLLVVDQHRKFHHVSRASLVEYLHTADLVIANDAATLPASLQGVHLATGDAIEVRLAGRPSLRPEDMNHFTAVVFGAGDYHTRTEDRLPPPKLAAGNKIILGPLHATVEQLLGHTRLVLLRFEGTADHVWAGLAHHGRPIQYAHLATPLALWDVWTRIAGPPVAFEPPSAGFALDWHALSHMRGENEFETSHTQRVFHPQVTRNSIVCFLWTSLPVLR